MRRDLNIPGPAPCKFHKYHYRSNILAPETTEDAKFVEELQNTLSQITKDGKKCFVLGDINSSPMPFLQSSHNLPAVLANPNHIDHIYTNVFTNPTNPFVVQEKISDHVRVAADLIATKSNGPRSDVKKKMTYASPRQ